MYKGYCRDIYDTPPLSPGKGAKFFRGGRGNSGKLGETWGNSGKLGETRGNSGSPGETGVTRDDLGKTGVAQVSP